MQPIRKARSSSPATTKATRKRCKVCSRPSNPKEDGRHAQHRKANAREPTEPVERFAKPFVVFDTPSAAALASPAATASFSGQYTTLAAQDDPPGACASEHRCQCQHRQDLQRPAMHGVVVDDDTAFGIISSRLRRLNG